MGIFRKNHDLMAAAESDSHGGGVSSIPGNLPKKPENPPDQPFDGSIDSKRQKEIRKLIDKVSIRLQAGIENGLFEQKNIKSNGPQWLEIQKKISNARNALLVNLDEAENLQEEALNMYYEAANKAGAIWRFSGLYAGHLWIFLVGILVSIFFFYYFSLDDIIKSNILSQDHQLAIDVVIWAIIGSVLRCFWWLRFNVGRSNYRKGWRLHYISAPFLGGILGAIVYILIFGGLVTISGPNNTPQNSFAMIPIAAFAGFNWEWAIRLFRKIEKLFDADKDEKSEKA